MNRSLPSPAVATSPSRSPARVATPRSVMLLVGPADGGMRRHVEALGTCLAERGIRVCVAGPTVDAFDLASGIERLLLPAWSGSLVGFVTALRAVRRAAADIEVLHAHGTSAGWLARIARTENRTRRRVPTVVTFHNVVLPEGRDSLSGTADDPAVQRRVQVVRLLRGEGRVSARTWVRDRLEAVLLSQVDAAVAVSPVVSRRFAGVPGAARLRTVSPFTIERGERPSGAASARARLGIPVGVPFVVSVGRLHPQKDHVTFLEAVALLREAQPTVRVWIVGEGPSREELHRAVHRLGLQESVSLVGRRGDVADVLAAADVFVSSAVWESVGLALLEALRAGIPVVSTPVGVMPDILVDGRSARLVPIGSPETMAHAIGDLLADPAAAATMAERGRTAAAAWDSVRQGLEQILHTYGEVLGC